MEMSPVSSASVDSEIDVFVLKNSAKLQEEVVGTILESATNEPPRPMEPGKGSKVDVLA